LKEAKISRFLFESGKKRISDRLFFCFYSVHFGILRPLNENERRERAFSVVHTPGVKEVAVRDKSFTFDKVFGVESSQVEN